jgi:hypothetical protein
MSEENDFKSSLQKYYKEKIEEILDEKFTEFNQNDDENNIILVKDTVKKKNKKKETIQGGTIYKLIEKLTTQEYIQVDNNYPLTFLLTYRSFINPNKLFDLLIERYDVPPKDINTIEEFNQFKKNTLMPIR